MRRQFIPQIMVIAMALIFSAMTAISFAQPPTAGTEPAAGPGAGNRPGGGMPGNMIEMRMKMLQDNLDLNKDQAAKIKAILTDEQKIASENRDKNKGDREAAMKSREQRRQQTDTKIRALLNKDQIAKYDKMLAEFRSNHPNMPGQPNAKPIEKATPGDTKPETEGTGK